MSINSTLTHWDAQSYVGLTQADDYFLNHPDLTRWDLLADAAKENQLVIATSILEGLPLFAVDGKMHDTAPYNQRLKLPIFNNSSYSGTPASGTTLTIVDSALAAAASYRDDYFNFGAVRITAGTNIYECRQVSDFAVGSGTITVNEAFTAAIDTTSTFDLIYPFHPNLIAGVCELALDLARGNTGEIASTMQLPALVRLILRDYFISGVRIKAS